MIYDKNFLNNLFYQENKVIFAKILSLDFYENIREEISGKILPGGTINVDGNSIVRRTCNLTLITDNIDINSMYWAQNSKFKLEIGVLNEIDSKYDEIIWFPQGIYIITSFSQVINTTGVGCNISISGKDKMCLLNGEVGGEFTSPTELAFEWVNGEKNFLNLKTIIFNLVNSFGRELIQNIIINDIEDYSLQAQQYVGDKPIYLYKDTKTQQIDKIETDLSFDTEFTFLISNSLFSNEDVATRIEEEGKEYFIQKIERGNFIGYKIIDTFYPERTLELKPGQTISAALDKIINIFSNFEYFYDVNGRFVFQKKKIYINSDWSYIKTDMSLPLLTSPETIYNFNKTKLLTSFSSTPNISNIKNDFSIWGEQEAEGVKKDIHIRYAIDKKPIDYVRTDEQGEIYTTDKEYLDKTNAIVCNWREIIYQMADDYYRNNQKGQEFYAALIKNNGGRYPNGSTGYEQYYADIYGFWRNLADENGNLKTEVLNNPENLDFWFDFIEGDARLLPYSVRNIGSRPKTVNNNKIKSLTDSEQLAIIWLTGSEEEYNASSLFEDKYQLFEKEELELSAYPTIKTAKSEFDKLLYNNVIAQQTINISTIPIYTLEPNTKIGIFDNENKINGIYAINRFSIPLSYSGTMSITAIQLD